MPTLALTNSLAFRQMRDPAKEFGLIRVLGTAGWIVAGLIVGSLKVEATALPMQIAAGCSVLMAVYCMTLPDTPPLATAAVGVRSLFPKEAVQVLAKRSVAVFALASLLICIPLQFYYAFTNLFLNEIGVQHAASKMTGGQASEVLFMVALPFFFRRLGVKWMLAVGMLAWVARYVMFAMGASGAHVWMLMGGIVLHGVCYDFFFVTGQIYIDSKVAPAFRAAAQGLITLITYGLGMLIGSAVSGKVVDRYVTVGGGHDWHGIWMFGAGLSAVVLVLFVLAFRDDAKVAVRVEDEALGVGAIA